MSSETTKVIVRNIKKDLRDYKNSHIFALQKDGRPIKIIPHLGEPVPNEVREARGG
jgi:hypothetical protein